MARRGVDDVMFLTGTDLIGHAILDVVLPGPSVFFKSFGLMVADGSKVQQARYLGAGLALDLPRAVSALWNRAALLTAPLAS